MDNIRNIWFSVIHCEIPNSFYLINDLTNTIIINSITYTVPSGNYNVNTLITALLLLIPSGFSITYNTTTLKFKFQYSTDFTINAGGSINKIIGMSNIFDYSSALNILIMPYIVNFLPIPRVNFRCSQLSFNNYNQGDGSSNTILSIQNNGNLGSMILWNNFSNLRFLMDDDIQKLSSLTFRITDDANNEIDLNGQNWFMCFQIDIDYIPINTTSNFSNIVNSAL